MTHHQAAQRVPYMLEYQGRTVILGEPEHLAYLDHMLKRRDVPTSTTVSSTGGLRPDGVLLTSLAVDLNMDTLWDTVYTSAFDDAVWPHDDSPLTVPQPPDWLVAARCWEYEPAAPVLPVVQTSQIPEPGGWVHRPSFNGADTALTGGSVGLFQLTDHATLWVFASAEVLGEIHQLGTDMARYRIGFTQMCLCFDEFERPGSLRLPALCRDVLEDELIAHSMDIESRFWPGSQ
ncbi:MAG: hypothetical protein Q4C81_09030 [Kocuria sp.]|nr:hypothetical protein [Kocuria sp.]